MLFTPIILTSMLAIDDNWNIANNNNYNLYLEVKDKYDNVATTNRKNALEPILKPNKITTSYSHFPRGNNLKKFYEKQLDYAHTHTSSIV